MYSVDFLREIMKSSPESSHAFMKASGFTLISYFLENISTSHLTPSFSDALTQLYPNQNASFQDGLIEHIFFNFKIFGQGSIDFQLYHLERLNFLLADNTSKIRSLIGTSRIFLALVTHFEYKTKSPSQTFSEANLFIRKVRSILFDTIQRAMSSGEGPLPEEITDLVGV